MKEKKAPDLHAVHHRGLQHLHPEQVEVKIGRADAPEGRHGLSSERDEMGSYVRRKAHPRCCWHAIDHHTGTVLASVFGRRQDTVFVALKALLEPFGIPRSCTGLRGLRAACRGREAHGREGKHAEDREQA